ncbi:hypothetical protein OAN24_02385 [Pseudodesulfovibrio sp.]|nr:hypothetical protein [Pseudodesulfovibrio sp.]
MTDIIITILASGTIATAAIFVAGFGVLFRSIRYPSIDSIALLAFSQAMTSLIRIDRNFLMVFEDDRTVYRHEKSVVFYSYNLTLNLLRLFSPDTRFRMAQWLNLAFYLVFASLVFLFFNAMFSNMGLEQPLLLAGFFTLALGVQTKLLVTATFIYSDILNYALFGITILQALHLQSNPSFLGALLFGSVIGLCFRNRQSDLILIIAGLLFLPLSGQLFALPLACLIGFIALNADTLYQQFVKGEPALDCLQGIMECNMPHCREGKGRTNLIEVVKAGLWQVVNIPGGKSLFVSTGTSMFLFPLSILAIIATGSFSPVLGYLLLCWLGFVAALLLVRENACDATAFFHLRQAYILMIIMHLFNGLAFGLFVINGWTIPCGIYLAVYGANLGHQAYKIVRFHFADTIHEEGLHTHPKNPPEYSVVLRDYLVNLPKPAIIMGSHMAWGEIHNFFTWSDDLRAVDLETKVDDDTLVELIDRYSVTHLALTPMSWYPIPGTTTIRSAELSPLLKSRLRPNKISEDVTVFDVIRPETDQAKDSI